MARRHTLPQLKRYDTTQRVLEALADAEARSILFSAVRAGRTAAELSRELGIPLSSVYKKISDLEELTLIRAEGVGVTDGGRRYRTYRSRISRAEITIRRPEPTLRLSPN